MNINDYKDYTVFEDGVVVRIINGIVGRLEFHNDEVTYLIANNYSLSNGDFKALSDAHWIKWNEENP